MNSSPKKCQLFHPRTEYDEEVAAKPNRRRKARRYRVVCPVSQADSWLFNTSESSLDEPTLRLRCWSPAPQTNRTFCRNFIQTKLHQIVYDLLKSCEPSRPKSPKTNKGRIGPIWLSDEEDSRPNGPPLLWTPTDQKYYREIPAANNCRTIWSVKDGNKAKLTGRLNCKPPWKP